MFLAHISLQHLSQKFEAWCTSVYFEKLQFVLLYKPFWDNMADTKKHYILIDLGKFSSVHLNQTVHSYCPPFLKRQTVLKLLYRRKGVFLHGTFCIPFHCSNSKNAQTLFPKLAHILSLICVCSNQKEFQKKCQNLKRGEMQLFVLIVNR